MNDVQEKLSELQGNGWTLAALADELAMTISAVEKWKAGLRYPGSPKPVLVVLQSLVGRRPPKQRRYNGTHHLQRRKTEHERKNETS